MARRSFGPALVLGAALALGACDDTARRGVAFLGPMELTDPKLVAGERAFMRACNQCHPRGEAGLGLALNDKPLPDFAIRAQVRAGLGAMPAFSREDLSDADLDAIIAYLDYLRGRGPFRNVL
ncbi:MAG TPA: cytochrome c [Azospirillum sp.]|nr:cytochrome c [Azospirillum sp.]